VYLLTEIWFVCCFVSVLVELSNGQKGTKRVGTEGGIVIQRAGHYIDLYRYPDIRPDMVEKHQRCPFLVFFSKAASQEYDVIF